MEDEKRTVSSVITNLTIVTVSCVKENVFAEMTELKSNAREDKEVGPECDSSGPTQEPLQSHTFPLKNNAAGLSEQLSSDAHQNPLNGAQPNPFVYSSAPAVPHAGNSLPSGALVNGPGSHPTSEESCVQNKGSVLPNNVLDTERQPEKDTDPQVLPPPIELQSDARQNTAGPVPKTLSTPPGATPPLSDTEESEAEVPRATLSGHGPDQTHISQIPTNKGIDAGSIWEFHTESSSESSSDDGDDDSEDAHWDPQKELIRFLCNGHAVNRSTEKQSAGPHYLSQRRRKHKIHTPEHKEEAYHCSNDTNSEKLIDDDEDDENVDTDYNFNSAVTTASEKGFNNENSTEPTDSIGGKKTKILKTEQSEPQAAFFPCTKCNVNFKEKRHLHRHMIHHLDGNNQVHHENVPRPFICRECGRLFRDHSSLLKHMIIHQERRKKLMEEIKGLNKPLEKGREPSPQFPQCAFRTNCPKTLVQHAKKHKIGKHCYSCEECSHVALTEQGLKAHGHKVHFNTQQTKIFSEDDSKLSTPGEDLGPALFHSEVCSFTTQNENALIKHSQLTHKELSDNEHESRQFGKVSKCKDSAYNKYKLVDQLKNTDIKALQLKPKFCTKRPAFWKTADLPYWTSGKADFYMRNPDAEKSHKGLHSSQFKHSLGSSTNKLSHSLQRSDKRSKLFLQPIEKIDVTTGLPYVKEDNQENDHIDSGILERTKYPSNIDVLLSTKTVKSGQISCQGYDSDSSQGDGNLASRNSEDQVVFQKSLSRRKMSTPLRSTIDRMAENALPKLHQRLKGRTALDDEDIDDEEDYDFSDYTSEATANFLDSSENKKNPYARSYFIRRQRALVEKDSAPVDYHFGKTNEEDDDSSDIQQLVIKEECVESAVCDDLPESPTAPRSDPAEIRAALGADQKSCPYCPALFESGVGLSNHVRGHLHRVGLTYDDRHMVSPEQVASQDCQPRIRRKIPSLSRRVKRADKPESQGEHTCPLCWGWFDTKTGLSNHVRGHLKRIGKTITSTSKSPLCILNELLRDEKEHQNVLQLLNRKQCLSRPFVSQKFIGSEGLFLTPTGIPVRIQHGVQANPPWRAISSREEGEELSVKKRMEIETQDVTEASSSTLVELLKKRKNKELEARDGVRKHFTVTKENVEGTQATGFDPNWAYEGRESNKKMCIHCNTIFPSAVSLSNHLRAYARRKRDAILEGTSYDCKQKKPRPRPGLKKKVSPLSNAVEQIYRLTCRFCDLVFQGPLSIQEDWIKHLQRHLMHTSVPHSGTGMVEILGFHQEISLMSNEELVPELHVTPPELAVVV